MKLYGGIDLHSNNSVIALLDDNDRAVYRKRLPNDLADVPCLARSRYTTNPLYSSSFSS